MPSEPVLDDEPGPGICPDCRSPTFPAVEHECGHHEWRFLVVRDGLPSYVAAMTTNVHEVPTIARDTERCYRHEPGARITVQRRWIDGWSTWEVQR